MVVTDAVPGAAVTAAQKVQTVSSNATGGTYTLAFDGQTTPALAFKASTSAVQTALEALTRVAGSRSAQP